MLTPRFVSWLRRLCRPIASRKPVVLALETLENRLTPSVAANDLFVSSLYQGLLGRDADPAGLTYWTGQLNAGVSRTQVAQSIGGSNEALNRDVQLFYDVLLHRPADDAGLTYWTDQLETGATLDQVKSGILGSDEFFSSVGGTDGNFVDSLYVHELGRAVDPNGLNFWDNQLAAGVSRATVADEVLATPEASREKVMSFFSDALDRTPDADGLNYWSAQLQAGVPETNVLAGILGSNEYFAKVENRAAATPQTDPNAAASDMIGALGLFTGPLPNAEYLAHRLGSEAPKPPVIVVDPAPPFVAEPPPADNPAPTNTDSGSSDNNVNTTDTTDYNYTDTNTTDYNNTDTNTTTDYNYTDSSTTDDSNVDPNATADDAAAAQQAADAAVAQQAADDAAAQQAADAAAAQQAADDAAAQQAADDAAAAQQAADDAAAAQQAADDAAAQQAADAAAQQAADDAAAQQQDATSC